MDVLTTLWSELEDLQRERIIVSDELRYWRARSAAINARELRLLKQLKDLDQRVTVTGEAERNYRMSM